MLESELLEKIREQQLALNPQILESLIVLAVEIAREGREGRKVGTLFVLGDVEQTLQRPKPLILDPLLGHPGDMRHLGDANMRNTIKELAQLDGAFIIDDDGTVLSATRYINASSSGIDLPLGLGSRHMAAASISKETQAVSVVVSESSVVRIFSNGEIVSEIIPELWLLHRHGLHGSFGG